MRPDQEATEEAVVMPPHKVKEEMSPKSPTPEVERRPAREVMVSLKEEKVRKDLATRTHTPICPRLPQKGPWRGLHIWSSGRTNGVAP